MPRTARIVLAGYPLHVIQRGVNRAAIFVDNQDRFQYLRLLRRACAKHEVAINGFVLMGNHVHLLLTPRSNKSVALAMQVLGLCYVKYFNTRHGRTGTLLEGRYKSCLVDSDAYFLMACRYIELNPVRAAIVARAEDYPWSSVHEHLGHRHKPWFTLHATYLSLGDTKPKRTSAYRRLLMEGISVEQVERIRRYSDQFQRMVERALNRPVTVRPQGRPRQSKD